ncbi:hypothetical protein B7P43_G06676, partial [Cryptotermes secundus]
VQNFRASASALQKKPPGSVRTVSFIRSLSRRCSRALGISDRSARRILHKDLNFHPYKMFAVQQLRDRDTVTRSTEAERVIILATDESHFHYASKKNFRYWAEKNPQKPHQRSLHIARVIETEWQTSEP